MDYITFSHSIRWLNKATAERKELVYSEFIAKISEYSAEQLIFINESAKGERTLSREYGLLFF